MKTIRYTTTLYFYDGPQVFEARGASPGTGLDEPLALEPQTGALAGFGELPDAGFFLHDRPAEADTVREARARNNLVLEVAVEPPEAAAEHRIRVSTLTALLGHVQTLVKHAYGWALRDHSLDARRGIDRSEAHLLSQWNSWVRLRRPTWTMVHGVWRSVKKISLARLNPVGQASPD
jgi:hypothetical protein